MGAEGIIEKSVPFAFDKSLGYLTSCPTNVGTGMRASVMLHLPALKLIGMLKILIDSVVKAGLAVRGMYGEGSEALGDMFQVSNQITLGVTEEDITATIKAVCEQIMEKEHAARDVLLHNKRLEIEDKLFRSWGLLKYARTITSKEFMQLLSDARLAVAMGFLSGCDPDGPEQADDSRAAGGAAKARGRELDTEERDIIRANYIRSTLEKKGRDPDRGIAPPTINRNIQRIEERNGYVISGKIYRKREKGAGPGAGGGQEPRPQLCGHRAPAAGHHRRGGQHGL